MAAHRYWRLSGLQPYDGKSVVELSELWLLNGATRADSGATLTSNTAPLGGTLSNLQDGNPATTTALAAGSTVTWDFGSAAEITNIQVGAGDTIARFLLGCAVERSDDGVTWREYQLLRNWMGIRWPGARALTANVLRVPPISHVTLRMSFEPASWWVNEYGPAVSFTVAAGAVAATASPIKGSRSVEFSGTGRLWTNLNNSWAFSAGTDFTIQAWIRPTAATAGNRIIAAFGGINAGSNVVYLALDPSTGVLSLSATGSTARFVSTPSGAFGPLNTSRHVAGSSENGVLRLFIDGALVATSSGANTLGANASPDLAIGNYSGSASNTFLGVIDEVGIDQKALYFSDFTPPASIVPQPEWLIDALTFAPKQQTATAVASQGATPPFSGAVLKDRQRARPNYFFDPAARGRIIGTVKRKNTPTNMPLARRVRLYRDVDGMLIAETWSRAADGVYQFDYIEEWQSYTAIALDHEHVYRMVGADNLNQGNGTLVLIP